MLLNAFYNDNDVLKFFENVIFLTKHTFIIIGKILTFWVRKTQDILCRKILFNLRIFLNLFRI